mmetsp:Transcript_27418/g.44496  ORF Transcript_27418/g.44496 Transcript_27418/m.44496 type:complete len:245 (-) Transcript_27418:320-1054(-)
MIQRQFQGERCSLVETLRRGLQRTIVLVHKTLGNEQPQPAPLACLESVCIKLHAFPEEFDYFIGAHSNTGVLDGQLKMPSWRRQDLLFIVEFDFLHPRRASLPLDPSLLVHARHVITRRDEDGTVLGRELQGVREEIPQHLGDARRVPGHAQKLHVFRQVGDARHPQSHIVGTVPVGRGCLERGAEVHPLPLRGTLEFRERAFNDVPDVYHRHLELEGGFDLVVEQDVVEDVYCAFCAVLDLAE